jgi:hypothetical protein
MTDASLPRATFAESNFRAGRVFGRTFSVLSRNLLPFCIVTAIASLPNFLFFTLREVGAGPVKFMAADPGTAAATLFLSVVMALVLSALSQAIILYAAFEDMRGRPVNLLESTKIGLRRFFPVFGVALATTFLASLAGLALVIPAFIVFTMLLVAPPACVVERLGPIKSMGRSARLTKGHRWKLFGLWLVTIIGGAVVQGALVGTAAKLGGRPLELLIQLVVGAVWGAFYAILVVVAYHDLRVAKEGVDTDQIAAVFD